MIKKAWRHLVGTDGEFSLENRILNAAAILNLAALLIFFVYDLTVVVVPALALVTLITLLVQVFFFYQSRFRKNFPLGRLGFSLGSYLFLILNYYYSSGIDGPTLFGFFVTFVVILVVTPRKQHPIWATVHGLVALGLLWFDYNNHAAINNAYQNVSDRYIDTASTYLITITLIFIITRYVVKHYNREKELAEERSKELAFLHNENNRLFSIISHDLRSPLNSIQGYLDLLNAGLLDDEEKATIQNHLLTITKSTSDMLFNLLAWSKSQMDGRSIDLQCLNLKQALASTLDILGHIATKKNIELERAIPDGISVTADAEMLQLVIRNLIYNAVKFTPEGGHIKVNAIVKDGRCTISVQDNGTGIPAEKQSQIFSTQIKSSAGTASEKGIGLGLILCRDFIALQGGNIWFTTEEGKGTTFFVSIVGSEENHTALPNQKKTHPAGSLS